MLNISFVGNDEGTRILWTKLNPQACTLVSVQGSLEWVCFRELLVLHNISESIRMQGKSIYPDGSSTWKSKQHFLPQVLQSTSRCWVRLHLFIHPQGTILPAHCVYSLFWRFLSGCKADPCCFVSCLGVKRVDIESVDDTDIVAPAINASISASWRLLSCVGKTEFCCLSDEGSELG